MNKTIIWPLGRNFVFHRWTFDYRYLKQLDLISMRWAFVDPNTGEIFDINQPDWINELLSEEEIYHRVDIDWDIQPKPDSTSHNE